MTSSDEDSDGSEDVSEARVLLSDDELVAEAEVEGEEVPTSSKQSRPAEPDVHEEPADVLDEEAEGRPEPLISKRGAPQIGYSGYVYGAPRDLADGIKVAWRCQLEDSLKCRCRVHTAGRDGPIVATIGQHNHMGDPHSAKVNKFRSRIKERASATFEPPLKLVSAALETVPALVQQAGPSKSAAIMLVYRKRKAENAFGPEPTDRASIDIPEKFSNYVTGAQSERFLLLDSGRDDIDRILVFGRESVGEDLSFITALYLDGTFSITPAMFAQVFVVTGRRGHFVQPLFYVLLPNRLKITYESATAVESPT